MRNIELLVTVESLEQLKKAVDCGANAVCVGGEVYGLQTNKESISIEELKEGMEYAHKQNVKVYITVNIFAHNNDLPEVKKYLEEIKVVGPDALLIAEPGVFTIAKEVMPEVAIHIAPQANNTNYVTYNFWAKLGVKRVASARELSLAEITEIRKHVPEELEIESFVHGSFCISYSGRQLVSNYLDKAAADNKVSHKEPIDTFGLVEVTRPDETMPVYENERGTFIFNSKDLCMIEYLPDMIAAGINSLKIEGQINSDEYVETAIKTYRRAIDDYNTSITLFMDNMASYKEELEKVAERPFTTGFYL
ncbi:MAG: peptidase U32 family protein [bacterium]|nr:peptidase U32 family protein [bacterium]